MNWIDARDLDQWANTPECAVKLPWLLHRLIRATTDRPDLKHINIPWGSSVTLAGWDGRAELQTASPFVPDGVSAWEMSCRGDTKNKADEDYTKRTNKPANVDPAISTFVFVTPRVWGGKEKWIADRVAEERWLDVRAFDATDLAQWIDMAPAVGAWLARELGKLPDIGIVSLEEFWDEWAGGTEPKISAGLVLAGRDEAKKLTRDWAQGPAAKFIVQAETKDEAVAFVYACAETDAQEEWSRSLFSRGLVVRTVEAWRALVRQRTPLVLIPQLSDEFSPSGAVQSGHYVLIPAETGEQTAGQGCTLSRLGREGFMEALRGMSLDDNAVRALARSTARSMPVVRRRLMDHPGGTRPEWASGPPARVLIPALLCGQWQENVAGDRSALQAIAGRPYDELIVQYVGLLPRSDAPLRKIGNRWRLTSHDEAWELLSPLLTQADLGRFREVVTDALSERSPAFDLPAGERYLAGVRGEGPRYSEIIQAGMSTTMALMGNRAERAAQLDTQAFVNQVVNVVLGKANDWRSWASIGGRLPTLAEAAPEVMLDQIEEQLEQPTFGELYAQEDDSLFGSCCHAGLLWALERLAWSTDHFSRVALILARLADLDPGGRWANRPRESLRGLFLPWIRHSGVSDQDRLQTLDQVMHRVPRAGWTLAIDVCPTLHDTITGRTPPDWRDWGQDVLQPTHADRYAFADAVIERVLQRAGPNPDQWADIISKYPTMPPARRKEALAYLQQHIDELKSSNGSTALWAKIRDLLHHHRSFPDAAWALPSEELDALTPLHEYLCPDDPIAANAWLFDHWPHLPQAEPRDYRESQAQFEHARSCALQKILDQHNQEMVPGLVRASPVPVTVGWTLALVGADLDKLIEFIFPYISDSDVSVREFAKGAMLCMHNQRGNETLDLLLKKAKSANFSAHQIAEIYGTASPNRETWTRLESEVDEVTSAYWSSVQNVYPIDAGNQDDLEYALEHLLDAHRAHDVIESLTRTDAPVASNLVIRAVELLPVELKTRREDGRRATIDGYSIFQSS